MRIAQLANFVGPASGGMRTAIAALGSGYVDAGCERLLIIPGPVDDVTSTELGDVVQLRAPRIYGSYRLIVEPWRVIDVLERYSPDSIELSDKTTLLPVARWARKNGVQSVLFSHERLDDMVSLLWGLERAAKVSIGMLNRLIVRSVDSIVVTSRYAQHEFQAVADAVGCEMVRVPLGVDLETFRPHPLPRRDDDVLRLVHFGRLSREKSPQLAIATALELHRRGVPVHLDVYGDGSHAEEIRAAVPSAAPVTFHGYVHDRDTLSRHIAAADVSLSVCPGETFGLAVLEALACGTPVVTADRGGARELVDAGSGAWAAPEPGRLADAVLDVADRPALHRRTAARHRAELFPWSETVDRMLAVHAGDRVEEIATA